MRSEKMTIEEAVQKFIEVDPRPTMKQAARGLEKAFAPAVPAIAGDDFEKR